ncbi:3-oxoacyl-(acyl-carrier-protein) synthase [Methylophilaceae bacterium 11]|nr:3-oxoacyl-(acyl-carrier-protein) synthase [Methylophilaceae bacterium 11]
MQLHNNAYYLSALGIVNALGNGVDEISHKLFSGDTSGLVLEHGWQADGEARVGRVQSSLPEIPAAFSQYACHNNRLLLGALGQIEALVASAIAQYGAQRIGVVLGTSTSGIAESEQAVKAQQLAGVMPEHYHYLQQELGMPAQFLAKYLALKGPAYAVSTACTSSAKAFQSARNLLKHGLCDAVLVGGVDSLCKTTINGFASLESTTQEISNPMSQHRKGINIGEGAALFLMTKERLADASDIVLLGVGESSDAYHISAPQPEGLGAEAAIRAALQDAGKSVEEIAYVNLHATGTLKNDEMESRAVARVFINGVPCSGTKPMTGHTLGAAGATELAFCWMAIQRNQLPPHVWDGEADSALPHINLISAGHTFGPSKPRICMSNSFAFGGSNVSLIIGEQVNSII